MDAKQLIRNLQTIPKFIKDLEDDRRSTLRLLYSSQSYSDTRVQTSKTNAQEAKTVAYLDESDYLVKHIEALHNERNQLLIILHQIKDLELVMVLLAVVNAETLSEAQEHLDMGQTKFFKLKKKAMAELDKILLNQS